MIQVTDFIDFHKSKTQHTAVTIGNFDGCHLGHQQLISKVVSLATQMHALPIAITFTPRPEAFFRQVASESLIFTETQKTRCLGELGIQCQVVQQFDAAFGTVSHIDFYEKYLLTRLSATAIVVGDDFHFGHKRLGNIDFLRRRGSADGVEIAIGNGIDFADLRISSSRLRELIRVGGDMKAITAMLGRPYLLEGVIERGDRLGRTIGFPTANLGSCTQITPRHGVYVGQVWLGESVGSPHLPPISKLPPTTLPAVVNIGLRPTVDRNPQAARIEAHLLADGIGPNALYGLRAGIYLTHRLRDEMKFPNTELLKEQISIDIKQAQTWLST